MQGFDARRLMLEKRLGSRCTGLLEITRDKIPHTSPAPALIGAHNTERQDRGSKVVGLYRVQYLHRTVTDYLSLPRIKDKLEGRLSATFDPHLRLCAAYMAFYKTFHHGSNGTHDPHSLREREALEKCFLHSRQVRGDGISRMVDYVRVLESVAPPSTSNFYQSWIRDLFPPMDRSAAKLNEFFDIGSSVIPKESLGQCVHWHLRDSHGFLSIAVHFKLVEYVKARLLPANPDPISQFSSLSKLRSPFRFIKTISRAHFHQTSGATDVIDELLYDAIVTISPSLPIIQLLLESGADLCTTHNNEESSTNTIWGVTLMAFIIVFRSEMPEREQWERVVRLMIKHGAGTRKSCVSRAIHGIRGKGIRTAVNQRDEESTFRSDVHKRLIQLKHEL